MHISYVGTILSFILVVLILKMSVFKTERHLFEEVSVILYLYLHFSTQSSPQPNKSNMCKARECFS